MEVVDLPTFDPDTLFETDLVIIGGGAAGLTIAREFIGTSTQVLVLESGQLEERPEYVALAELESVGEPSSDAQKQKRIVSHGSISPSWSQEKQPFGLRCRALGGSTHAWAGKSAAFDAIDFETRSWVPNSGWPITRSEMDSYIDRAAEVLNLGPNVYDDGLWDLIGISPPQPALQNLRSFFWQFARSRIDQLDVMRFGSEFLTLKADNIRVLLNATVTHLGLTPDGGSFETLDVATLAGVRHKVKATSAVVAASAIENARLLLVSNSVQRGGIGNSHDVVGRYLMDHAVARAGMFDRENMTSIIKRFGFYGVRHDARTHMYMHGLAPLPDVQEREQLLNSAVYFMPERSPDDPWDALKRLLRRKSSRPAQDVWSTISGAGLLAKGLGMKAFSSGATPEVLKKIVIDVAIRHFPNFVVEEFQNRGLPHKLTGVAMDIISEQRPDRESRITLSERTDRLGVPLAKVDWRINENERRTISRLAHMTRDALSQAGFPQPVLEPWIAQERLEDGIIIDFGHTMGTTRMSDDPRSGVVDTNCQVHGIRGLYVAGASTFPTGGHANPTLMILALAIRLADNIKSGFGKA